MVSERYSSRYKKDNIKQLRRMLKMTQKEFLEYFMMKDNGKTAMSVATLSNLESKGGERVNEVITAVCLKLNLDSMLFSLEPQEFINQAEHFVMTDEKLSGAVRNNSKNGGISELVNRLTMYFADEMLEGRLKRGDQIPSDRELAARLGLGRSAVREALKVLDVLGMIDIRLGQGMYIANRESNFFTIPLSWSLFLDGRQVRSILQVRGALEIRSADLAARCTDEAKLAKLTNIYYQMQQTFENASKTDADGGRDLQKALQETLDADIEFHTCIAECSGNPILLSMLQTIRNFLKRVSGTGMVDLDQLKASFNEHRTLYGAIISHNSEYAMESMWRHMQESSLRYNVDDEDE